MANLDRHFIDAADSVIDGIDSLDALNLLIFQKNAGPGSLIRAGSKGERVRQEPRTLRRSQPTRPALREFTKFILL
jgi:hypothetical protein